MFRQRFGTLAPFLDERGRRLVAASEAVAAGYGGIAAVRGDLLEALGNPAPDLRASLVSVAKLVDFDLGQVSYTDFIGITILPGGIC
jgi:hypothetical protein